MPEQVNWLQIVITSAAIGAVVQTIGAVITGELERRHRHRLRLADLRIDVYRAVLKTLSLFPREPGLRVRRGESVRAPINELRALADDLALWGSVSVLANFSNVLSKMDEWVSATMPTVEEMTRSDAAGIPMEFATKYHDIVEPAVNTLRVRMAADVRAVSTKRRVRRQDVRRVNRDHAQLP